jgi:hypothetical protein
MLVIRAAQMLTFYDAAVDCYVQASLVRIERRFEAEFARLGRIGVEALVRDGVARAQRYAVESNAQVDRFVDLMLTVAPDFDARPDMAWAASILGDAGIDERAKMDLIYASPRLPAAAPR